MNIVGRSYNADIYSKDDSLIDMGRVQQFLSMESGQYRGFVEGAKDCPDPFKNVYAGFILGGVSFIKDKLTQLKEEVESKDFAHKRAVKNITEPKEVINAGAACFKLDPEQICKSNEAPRALARGASLSGGENFLKKSQKEIENV